MSQVFILPTQDGSPTARLSPDGELMHSSFGAWSETLYIYKPAATLVFEKGWPNRFLSVGLGMGYVEMMIIAEAMACQKDPALVEILSFENSPLILGEFDKWVRTGESAVFESSLRWVAQHYGHEPRFLYSKLAESFNSGRWIIEKELVEIKPHGPFSAVFYDAFSKKSGEEVWAEEFLNQFLKTYCSEKCVFTTYAATSALKRALKSKGFLLSEKPGFTGKRESTWAVLS
jgi:hypothetical protein